MGHAAHFLRRLDRVSDAQVELALTLYRDDALLREVLNRASLPDSAERVAISLEHPTDGPFVVVTREGRFVTCLGAGMRTGDLPIVTRERLDLAASSVQRMREQLERVRVLRESNADGQAALAFRRMQQQGPRFAREDAQTLLHAMPLIESICCGLLRQLLGEGDRHLEAIGAYRLDEPGLMSPAEKDYVHAVGDMAWSIANLVALVTPQSLRRADAKRREKDLVFAVGLLAMGWGTLLHVSRTLWLMARGGKATLAAVKRFNPGRTTHSNLWRQLSLGAIALRSEKLRAEATKAVTVARPEDPDAQPQVAVVGTFGRLIVAGIESPEDLDQVYCARSREWVRNLAAAGGDPIDDDALAAIPDDVIRAAGMQVPVSLHEGNGSHLALGLPLALPWLASTSPEQLFLPGVWARRLLPGRDLVGEIRYMLRPCARVLGFTRKRRPPITRDAPKAGRNDPCPCGSGKKHKRCCG